MSKRAIALLLFPMLLLLNTAGAQDSDDQKFLLTFIPNIQFAPLYTAIENGHFDAMGLDIQIEHLDEPVVVDLIATNQEQFGVVSGEQVIMARSQQRPIVYIYEWFQRYPVGIVVPESSDIDSVTDLAGRNVGIPGRFGASYSGLVALLSEHDMTASDLELEEIGFNAPDVVCVGGVEASVIYVNNEPLQIANRAEQDECGDIEDVRVFDVASEVDLVSNGLITNEQTIAEQPQRVQAVVNAYHNGLQDTINNPARAYLLSLDYVENLPINTDLRAALEEAATDQAEFLATRPDRAAIADSRDRLWESLSAEFDSETLVQFEVFLETIDLWDADRLGYSELSSWEVTQETLRTMDFLAEEIGLEAAFTNEFVPQVEE